MAEEQNCTGGPELCRSEPVETRLQIQVIIISISRRFFFVKLIFNLYYFMNESYQSSNTLFWFVETNNTQKNFVFFVEISWNSFSFSP